VLYLAMRQSPSAGLRLCARCWFGLTRGTQVWPGGHREHGQHARPDVCYQCLTILLIKVFNTLLGILQSDGSSDGLVLFVRAQPWPEEWLA
jgi:hypothetical protein